MLKISEVARGIRDNVFEKVLKKSELDIISKASIDTERIDVVCAEHPVIFAFWAVLYRQAEVQLEKAEYSIQLMEAKLDSQIRKTDSKLKEAGIKSRIRLNKNYQHLKEVYFRRKFELGMMKAFIRTLEQREDMLNALSRSAMKEFHSGIRAKEKEILDTLQISKKRRMQRNYNQ